MSICKVMLCSLPSRFKIVKLHLHQRSQGESYCTQDPNRPRPASAQCFETKSSKQWRVRENHWFKLSSNRNATFQTRRRRFRPKQSWNLPGADLEFKHTLSWIRATVRNQDVTSASFLKTKLTWRSSTSKVSAVMDAISTSLVRILWTSSTGDANISPSTCSILSDQRSATPRHDRRTFAIFLLQVPSDNSKRRPIMVTMLNRTKWSFQFSWFLSRKESSCLMTNPTKASLRKSKFDSRTHPSTFPPTIGGPVCHNDCANKFTTLGWQNDNDCISRARAMFRTWRRCPARSAPNALNSDRFSSWGHRFWQAKTSFSVWDVLPMVHWRHSYTPSTPNVTEEDMSPPFL